MTPREARNAGIEASAETLRILKNVVKFPYTLEIKRHEIESALRYLRTSRAFLKDLRFEEEAPEVCRIIDRAATSINEALHCTPP